MIIRIVQLKGRKDRPVMLPAEVLEVLRQWWKLRPTAYDDAGIAPEQRCLFLGRGDHQPLTTRQFSRLFKEAAKAAGLGARYPACAALPMPPLWCAHDRHRDLRARLRAEPAPDTNQGRHLMSQTSCARRRFPVAMRWLSADGNLSRPNTIDHGVVRALIRSEQPPKSLPHPADLPYVLTRRSIPVSIASTTETRRRH